MVYYVAGPMMLDVSVMGKDAMCIFYGKPFGRIILKGNSMPPSVRKQLLTCYWILVNTHKSWILLDAPRHLSWGEPAEVYYNI